MLYLHFVLLMMSLTMIVLSLFLSKKKLRLKILVFAIILVFLSENFAISKTLVTSASGNLFNKHNLVDFEINGNKYCYDSRSICPDVFSHVGTNAWFIIEMWWNSSYPVAIGIATKKAVETAASKDKLETIVMSDFRAGVQSFNCTLYEYDEYVIVIKPACDYHQDVACIMFSGNLVVYTHFLLLGFCTLLLSELLMLLVLIDVMRKRKEGELSSTHL
jgi:hypothetical protein